MMLRDRVLFTGTSFVSHPVLDRLFGGYLEAPQDDRPHDVAGYRLVVVDARLAGPDLGDGGTARKALEAGVPVLILSPNEAQLEPLASVIGAAPRSPMQAVFIAPNANRKEPTRFEATLLGYPPQGTGDEAHDGEIKSKDRPKRESGGCGEKREAAQGDHAIGNFAVHVESRVEKGFHPAALTLPDGLKYFQTNWNPISPFTSSHCDDDGCFTNGQGSFTIGFSVWGFLNQTSTSNSQYLIIEATYNVNPGTLATNDDEGRGFLNTRVRSSVGPTSGGFAPADHIPTNGTNSWNESFSINISYKDPLGGYQIYTYNANVTQAIDSWSVQNSSSGSSLGSTWFINSPVNGENMGDTWDDAFSTSGHVELFPSASTGTITAKEVSAWLTNTIQSGNVTVQTDVYWDEDVFFSTSCGLLICYSTHRRGVDWHWWPSLTVNFSTITPS